MTEESQQCPTGITTLLLCAYTCGPFSAVMFSIQPLDPCELSKPESSQPSLCGDWVISMDIAATVL
jgi:hypothetical protein